MEKPYILQFAVPDDADNWMELVDIVKDNFPGFDRDEYVRMLVRNIERKSALCVKHNERIVGILLFSISSGCLSCMAVHPDHRKQGIGSALVEKMISLFPDDMDISVETFRRGDKWGDAPRALYEKYGFVEDELFIGIGEYPVQKFILHR